MQLSASLYFLPVLRGRFLRGRFDSNVNVTGFVTIAALFAYEAKIWTSQMWNFWMLETENGKMTRQEYEQRYLYIKMTDKTGIRCRAHSHSHRLVHGLWLIQPNKSEVSICNSSAENKLFEHAKLKENVHQKAWLRK